MTPRVDAWVTESDAACQSSTAIPHHKIVVRCQAKRRVRVVNAVPPNNLGRLSRRNSRREREGSQAAGTGQLSGS